MLVLDASALTDLLLMPPGGNSGVADELRAAGRVHSIDFVDIEVVSALRRQVRRRVLDPRRAGQAIADLGYVPLRRHRAAPLAQRAWQLRESLSAYDAAYVALAETLRLPLLTTDARLARSRGHRAEIREPTG